MSAWDWSGVAKVYGLAGVLLVVVYSQLNFIKCY